MILPKPVFKRPWLHHVIIVGYIAAPFANILLMRVFLNVPLRVIMANLFAAYGILATAWLVTAPIVGIALYFVSRFSWYLFLGHSAFVILDFVIKWASRPSFYLKTVPGIQNLLLLVGNVALVGFVAFILQRDFRAPYFQVLNRGWRERRRYPLSFTVDLEGRSAVASDLSASGCFVVDRQANRVPGGRVRLSLPVDERKIECRGDIMRATPEGFGIRFVGLTAEEKREIGRMMKTHFHPAQKVGVAGSPEPARF